MRRILVSPLAGVLYIAISFLVVKDFLIGEPHNILSSLEFLVCFSSISIIIFFVITYYILYKNDKHLRLGFLMLLLAILGSIMLLDALCVAFGAPAKQTTTLSCMVINMILGLCLMILEARFGKYRE